MKLKLPTLVNTQLQFSFCHQMPERSFFWRGKQLPICSRCTGINLGYLAMPFFILGFISIPLISTILMIFPTYIDGSLQAFYKIESNNPRRFITGLLCGIGTMSIISKLGIWIGNQILLLIN